MPADGVLESRPLEIHLPIFANVLQAVVEYATERSSELSALRRKLLLTKIRTLVAMVNKFMTLHFGEPEGSRDAVRKRAVKDTTADINDLFGELLDDGTQLQLSHTKGPLRNATGQRCDFPSVHHSGSLSPTTAPSTWWVDLTSASIPQDQQLEAKRRASARRAPMEGAPEIERQQPQAQQQSPFVQAMHDWTPPDRACLYS